MRDFERARHMPGLEDSVYAYIVWNLGMLNRDEERWATAVMYFEEYATMSGGDAEEAQPLIDECRAGTRGDAESVAARGEVPLATDADLTTSEGADAASATWDHATALAQQGRYRQAIILYEQLREQSSDQFVGDVQASAEYNIGIANQQLGRHEAAILCFQRYLRMETDEAELAVARERLRASRSAVGALSPTGQAQMLYRSMHEAKEAGDWATVLRFCELVVDLDVGEDIRNPALWNMAIAYWHLGRSAMARFTLEQYCAAEPDDEEAAAELVRLNERIARGEVPSPPASTAAGTEPVEMAAPEPVSAS